MVLIVNLLGSPDSSMFKKNMQKGFLVILSISIQYIQTLVHKHLRTHMRLRISYNTEQARSHGGARGGRPPPQ